MLDNGFNAKLLEHVVGAKNSHSSNVAMDVINQLNGDSKYSVYNDINQAQGWLHNCTLIGM